MFAGGGKNYTGSYATGTPLTLLNVHILQCQIILSDL